MRAVFAARTRHAEGSAVAVMAAQAVPVSELKAKLRARMRARRGALEETEVRAASERAQTRLIALNAFAAARTLALFSAAQNEPHTDRLAAAALARGARLCFPRVEGRSLVFHEVRSLADLSPGAFGVLEPAAVLPVVAASALDFLLVPGLAFGEDGSRLGFGKGFYDGALAGLRPGACAAGFCHDFQLLAQVPVEAHDVPVDLVVTDRRCARRGS